MQSALQDHPLGRLDFVLRGVDDLPIDGKAFLPGEASRLALTRDQSRVEEELRDRSRPSRNLDGRRSRRH